MNELKPSANILNCIGSVMLSRKAKVCQPKL